MSQVRRYELIIIDEVGHIPFDQDAVNLFFQLIACRYEQGSMMVTSTLPFGRWGETFSDDDDVAAAVIDPVIPTQRSSPSPATPAGPSNAATCCAISSRTPTRPGTRRPLGSSFTKR